jgi:hypothetical protein
MIGKHKEREREREKIRKKAKSVIRETERVWGLKNRERVWELS